MRFRTSSSSYQICAECGIADAQQLSCEVKVLPLYQDFKLAERVFTFKLLCSGLMLSINFSNRHIFERSVKEAVFIKALNNACILEGDRRSSCPEILHNNQS